MENRIEALRALLREKNADSLLVTSLPDIRWACGFTGSNGLLLVTGTEAHFVSDGRYTVQAKREVVDAKVHIPGYNLFEHIVSDGLFGLADSVLYQADHLTVSQLNGYREKALGLEWIPGENLFQLLVARKEAWEIERIRKAQRITDEVFNALLEVVRPGMTEREVAAEIVYQHLRHGAEGMSFETIVGSGPNGALPHAHPSNRRIESGDMIVLDFGCFADGYASDMTRTIAVGEPGSEARKVYQVVRDAMEAAIGKARAGMSSKALDATARDVIANAGYGEYFSHSLGHGVGLQIHEWPRVSYNSDELLPERAVVTIEPGIYLPEQFGVRIEDMVVLGEQGCTNLTASPKELIVL